MDFKGKAKTLTISLTNHFAFFPTAGQTVSLHRSHTSNMCRQVSWKQEVLLWSANVAYVI